MASHTRVLDKPLLGRGYSRCVAVSLTHFYLVFASDHRTAAIVVAIEFMQTQESSSEDESDDSSYTNYSNDDSAEEGAPVAPQQQGQEQDHSSLEAEHKQPQQRQHGEAAVSRTSFRQLASSTEAAAAPSTLLPRNPAASQSFRGSTGTARVRPVLQPTVAVPSPVLKRSKAVRLLFLLCYCLFVCCFDLLASIPVC